MAHEEPSPSAGKPSPVRRLSEPPNESIHYPRALAGAILTQWACVEVPSPRTAHCGAYTPVPPPLPLLAPLTRPRSCSGGP